MLLFRIVLPELLPGPFKTVTRSKCSIFSQLIYAAVSCKRTWNYTCKVEQLESTYKTLTNAEPLVVEKAEFSRDELCTVSKVKQASSNFISTTKVALSVSETLDQALTQGKVSEK